MPCKPCQMAAHSKVSLEHDLQGRILMVFKDEGAGIEAASAGIDF